MSISLNPYISFNGNAGEALEFYKTIFGGEAHITKFSDFPDMPVAEEHKNLVMHADLISGNLRLMLSDATPMGGVKVGENVKISLSGEDKDILTEYFNGLSQDGKVVQPLVPQVWGDTFGMLTDKFGIGWLVNIRNPEAKS